MERRQSFRKPQLFSLNISSNESVCISFFCPLGLWFCVKKWLINFQREKTSKVVVQNVLFLMTINIFSYKKRPPIINTSDLPVSSKMQPESWPSLPSSRSICQRRLKPLEMPRQSVYKRSTYWKRAMVSSNTKNKRRDETNSKTERINFTTLFS